MTPETFDEVVRWVLGLLSGGGLVRGVQFLYDRRQAKLAEQLAREQASSATARTQTELGSTHVTDANRVTDTAIKFLEQIRLDVTRLQARVDVQDKEIEKLKGEVSHLRVAYRMLYNGAISLVEQIKELGHVPRFDPDTVVELPHESE